ncbi:TPA: hypothetical protein ACMDRZ_003017 [Vibrio cholerae]|uniref:Uncharacterized protein n=1 Tax=Vibrio vulnificus TaxID=672 RepID=A0AAI8ZLI2_VIBVL|nr:MULTISPECIES: hypothetical protein [Vibrio]EHU8077660.1 hypothetical protein [Vibrio cholerae]EHV9953716.1 hypothetical protein [Vibrio cholerae]EKF9218941.1 hypothetical protein [Vibrio cholerae]MEB5557099.1 hypothetical protein [Vibrio cholerae]OQK43811.1 hypothetical protein XM75_u0092 [Vibrio vulnificus]
MNLSDLKEFAIPLLSIAFGAGFWSFLVKRQEKRIDDARADEVMIQGATSVVELQQKVMKQLQDDLDRRVKAIEDLYSKQLASERREWELERSKLVNKIAEMSQRLEKLERLNKSLQRNESLVMCEHCIAEAASAQQ